MNEALIFFLVFLAIDLLISIVRAALVHARPQQLIAHREVHPESVERTMRLLERPSLRISLRVGVVVSHTILAGLAWLLVLDLLPLAARTGWAVGGLFLAAVIILMLEYALEGVVLRNAERWALRFTGLGRFLDLLFYPLARLMMLLLRSPEALQRQLISVTDDELKSWVATDQPQSTLEVDERKMIYSIFHFSETLCREVMVPRIDVFGLEVNTSLAEAIEAIGRQGHSRIPVYSESIDNILGFVYAKDLLKASLGTPEAGVLRKLLRPPYFVPEAKKVDELLREMQDRGVHIAVVVDEYGGTAGIVTLEDIVEEIVGEIRDEYDQSEESLYQMIGLNEYLFAGKISLDDVNELLGIHLSNETADTLGGYFYGEVGRIPSGGEELVVDDWVLRIEQVSGRRIRKVRALRKPAEPPEEAVGNNPVRGDSPTPA